MPASLEQLLVQLEAPHWKTPGSTSRKTEGRTAQRTEGQAPVNLTVLDTQAEGHQVLDRVAKLGAEGTPLARREAAALEAAQAMKTEALMHYGEVPRIRQHRCPACGCYSLAPRDGMAICSNRHCGPPGIERRWSFRDLAFAGPGTPKRIRRSEGRPYDVVDQAALVVFLAPTEHPMSSADLTALARTYGLPVWRHPAKTRLRMLSLSDVLTAHAVHTAGREPSTCATPTTQAACTGLADLFFGTTDANAVRVDQAKALCGTCPLKQACLDQAMQVPHTDQFGIFGGLTAAERKQLIRTRKEVA
ncbi:WhiB family transcriptional regulator (plasmid) [Streptomyces sp. NBC_01259]|uniref:WhiB family transcriptional regulator n=1 Tax=Streptomyces sp. NBC_01259 TaxID=2903800 RepID=UPI002F90C397